MPDDAAGAGAVGELSAAELTTLRARAVEVAYRMLGSRTEAEDVAQETMVRVQAAMGREEIRTPAAYTTTVATRLAIDHLRSARVRRESYVGPWLPEPISGLSAAAPGYDDVGAGAALADSVSFAMLVVLESLGPVERAAFLLHDTFGYGYDELAVILDRNEAACRQLVSRARTRVADGRPRFTPDPEEHRELLARFVDAAQRGDVEGLLEVLAPDAVFVSDGGANVMAARHPIMGADRVSRFVSFVWTKPRDGVVVELTTVNGEPGIAVWVDGVLTDVGTAEIRDGRISTMHFVRNPDKLHWVEHEPS